MTTFISYSRINSDFAVRLATDLKAAGYDVWLDQLDIPTGARWDDEIEKMLEICSTFLIILSPQSIQSQNVKDEIGYAIDSGKHILPIVLENCKVPFRLRRFQYVDASGITYEDSLSKIRFLLDNAKKLEAAAKSPDEKATADIPPAPIQNVVRKAQASAASLQKKSAVNDGARKWSPGIVAIGVFVVILGIIAAGALIVKNSPKPPLTDTAFVTESSTQPAALPSDTAAAPTETPTETPFTPTVTSIPDEIVDEKGVVMRLVPGGDFTQGSNDAEPDERPVHTVHLEAFYMDAYEVTNQQYSVCVADGVCASPAKTSTSKNADYFGNQQFQNYPMVNVDWEMAKTYCEWRGAQLPTEAQWEKSARGTDGRIFPWGDKISCSNANFGGCIKDLNVVGSNSSGESVYGIFDLAGNAWEWMADWYSADYYSSSPGENPTGPNGGKEKVMRGGSWSDLGSSARSSNRYSNDPKLYGDSVGFRCAKDVNP